MEGYQVRQIKLCREKLLLKLMLKIELKCWEMERLKEELLQSIDNGNTSNKILQILKMDIQIQK
jgi:hypothetical protein